MKYLKNLKLLALLLVLAGVGNANAQENFPDRDTISCSKIKITSNDDWKEAKTQLSSMSPSVTNVCFDLQTDVVFSDAELGSLNFRKRNVYVNGSNHTISGISQDGPLFSNPGETVFIDSVFFKDIENIGTRDTAYDGAIFDNVNSVKNFYIRNVTLDNVKIKRSIEMQELNVGIFGGVLSGSLVVSELKATDLGIDSVRGTNIGGLFGAVNGSVRLNNVDVEGKMVTASSEDDEKNNGTGIGGLIGSLSGNVLFKDVTSKISVTNSAYTSCASSSGSSKSEVPCNGVGGFLGKAASANSYDSLHFSNVVLSGQIVSTVAKDAVDMGIGGFVGFIGPYFKVAANHAKVEKYQQLYHKGSKAFLGGFFGYAANVERLVIDTSSVENGSLKILMSNDSDGGALGGMVGAALNTGFEASENTYSSTLSVEKQGYGVNEKFVEEISVGGLIGSFKGGKKDLPLNVKNFLGAGKISLTTISTKIPVYAGGVLGYADVFDSISISKSKVVSKKSTATETGYIIESTNPKGTESDFSFGGLVGYVRSGEYLTIDSSAVYGNMFVDIADNYRSSVKYVSGLVGFAEISHVDLKEFAFEGNLDFQNDLSAFINTIVAVSGILSQGNVESVNLTNGYLLSENVENIDVGFSVRKNVLVNNALAGASGPSVVGPAYVHSLNQEGKAWYFDGSDVKLRSLCDDSTVCIAPNQIVFKDYNGRDLTVYTKNDGDLALKEDGTNVSPASLPKSGVVKVGVSLQGWVNENGDIWNSSEKWDSDHTFAYKSASVPKFAFKTDSTSSGNAIFSWNGGNFNISSDTVLPSAIFVSGQYNGSPTYAISEKWVTVEDTPVSIESIASLKSYIVAHENMDTITLALDEGNKTSYQSLVCVENGSNMSFTINVMGDDYSIDFLPQCMYVPHTSTLSVDSTDKENVSMVSFRDGVVASGGVIADSFVVLGKKIDLSRYAHDSIGVMLHYDYNNGSSSSTSDPNSSSSSGPNPSSSDPNSSSSGGDGSSSSFNPFGFSSSSSFNPYGGSSSSNPVVDPMIACVDSSFISDVGFLKSGKSAAKFSFMLNIKKGCGSMEPVASVSGPNGFNWDSSLVSATRSYNFTFYPLEPGTYKFRVKLAEGKDTTFLKTFKADMSVSGHKWNLAAVGTWPKGVVDNDEATVYGWSQDVLIGDYWQYEALPNVQSVVEDAGYWIYAEKDLEFSLDLPLKKAESDSIAWNLKKNFNGWNLIANPYSWDLEATSVQNFMDPESNESPFWRLNSDGELEVASVLGANEAFWISTDKNRTIKVSTKPTFSSAKASKNSLKKANPGSWSMALVATSENGTSDSWNVLGVGSKNIALEEPPAGKGDFVSVAFEGEGNAKLAKRILAKSNEKEYTWNVDLKASEAGKVKLTLEGLSEVRAMGYKAVLVVDGETAEFGSDATVSVDVSTKSKKALLKVVPAEVKVVTASRISDVHYSVAAGRMDVLFSVPFAMAGRTASVNLMDVNGKVIARAQGKANAGSNALQIASPVRNGVYVLQVRVGNDSRVVRLAL